LTARKQTAYFPALVVLGTGVRSLSAVHAKRPFVAASRLTSRSRLGNGVCVRCIVVALLRVAADGAGNLAIHLKRGAGRLGAVVEESQGQRGFS
jgi:hypothetical protein